MTIYNRLVIRLLLIFYINSSCQASSVSSLRLQTSHWDDIPDNNTRLTLRSLQNYENGVDAILHFIEWTHSIFNDSNTKCVKKSLSSLQFPINPGAYKSFFRETEIALKTANLLTNLFTNGVPYTELQSRNLHSTSLFHQDFFPSLVKANVQSDQLLFGSGIAFLHGRFNQSQSFSPFAYRNKTFHSQIVLRDLVSDFISTQQQANNNNDRNYHSLSGDWFWKDAITNYSIHFNNWLQRGGHFDITTDDGIWTSPYYDCQVTKMWLITYLVPFYGKISPNQNVVELKGVVHVSVDLNQTDINQCAQDNSFFADTHKCHSASTQCHPIKGMGFRRGGYNCQCKDGFYIPSKFQQEKQFKGSVIEEAFIATLMGSGTSSYFYPQNFLCLPCQQGCRSCIDDSPCFVQFDANLRNIILAIQCLCIISVMIIALSVFKLRRSKTIATSRWIMLEMILFGAFILYTTVIVRYYESSSITCMIEPWLREVGFAFCYGSIIIKVYRIFAEFQTRKAHRVCVRDKDLLKYLFGIILVVVGYMAAWTALVLDGIDNISNIGWFGNRETINITKKITASNIIEQKASLNGLEYVSCRKLSWDYITELGELCFLLTGVYITYCIRNAKKEIYREKWNLAFSIYLETIVSLITYIIKHSFWYHPSLLPDHIFLLYTIRCHLTVTVMLIILFLPKIWYHNRTQRLGQNRSRHLSSFDVQDHLPGAMRMQTAILSNGEVDISDVNITDMDPEDIRSELRRVYTQLQVLKNKTMRKDNPHISKRRGGRKSHRRFSLQPFHHKHKHEHETTEISRTPEESTASLEGTSQVQADGPSTIRIDSDGANSAKSYHK